YKFTKKERGNSIFLCISSPRIRSFHCMTLCIVTKLLFASRLPLLFLFFPLYFRFQFEFYKKILQSAFFIIFLLYILNYFTKAHPDSGIQHRLVLANKIFLKRRWKHGNNTVNLSSIDLIDNHITHSGPVLNDLGTGNLNSGIVPLQILPQNFLFVVSRRQQKYFPTILFQISEKHLDKQIRFSLPKKRPVFHPRQLQKCPVSHDKKIHLCNLLPKITCFCQFDY